MRAEKLGYVWIDTCCIDKKSGVELSEAINSMSRWYRDATYILVYQMPSEFWYVWNVSLRVRSSWEQRKYSCKVT